MSDRYAQAQRQAFLERLSEENGHCPDCDDILMDNGLCERCEAKRQARLDALVASGGGQMPPPEVLEAARIVSLWIKENHITGEWGILDIGPRRV